MGKLKGVATHVGIIVAVIVVCAYVSRATDFGKKLFGTGA